MFLRNFFTDILTETTKEFDITRVAFFLLVITYISLSVYMITFEHKFDFLDWSIGASTILGAGGASVGVRARLEDHSKNRTSINIETTDNKKTEEDN